MIYKIKLFLKILGLRTYTDQESATLDYFVILEQSRGTRFFNDKVLHFIYPTLAAEKSQSNLELKQCRSQDQTILFGHLGARKPLPPFSGASEKSMRNQ